MENDYLLSAIWDRCTPKSPNKRRPYDPSRTQEIFQSKSRSQMVRCMYR